MFVTDCDANVNASHAEMIFAFTREHTLGFFPLPDNRWRIDGKVPQQDKKSEKVTFDYIESQLSKSRYFGLLLTDPGWFSIFRSHSRYAPVFRYFNCFLAGDAAHIHSPVGAQGMNTGLQDGYNLGWKLAFVMKGFASEDLLQTYQEERLPVARKIIAFTDIFFRVVISDNFLAKNIRLLVMPVLLKLLHPWLYRNSSFRRRLFGALAGLSINYHKSSLTMPLPGAKYITYLSPAPEIDFLVF
ncbi:MAG: hypothetical protein HC905_18860, partial [Bacteroidales bacterium]|nr:hypothetical protein [Bacteroidales bacterium]